MKTELNLGFKKKGEEISKDNSEYEKLVSFIKTYLKKKISKYPEINSILLFGSYATKTFTEESDVDSCIIFKNRASKSSEELVFEHFLSLGKEIDKSIQCVFIYPERIHDWDRIFIENMLAEGKLLYGNSNYQDTLKKALQLDPYQIITLNLRRLDKSNKMKLKRILYGYKTSKKYSDKIYSYQKQGLVYKLKGVKLGRGSFIIPEKEFPIIEKELYKFDILFSRLRVWMQKI